MILYDILVYVLSEILSVCSIVIIFLLLQCTSHFSFFFMSAVAESHAPKRLLTGCHVSGTFGELIPNPDPTKRQGVRKRLFGNVICANGHGKYRIAFDEGSTMECFLNRLRAESSFSSVPPEVIPPQVDAVNANLPPRAQADIEEEADGIIESIEDSHEEEEHVLPTPELDEGKDGTEEDDAVENQGQHDPEGQMPGQLPAAVMQVKEVRTYAQCKERAKDHIHQLLGQEVEIHQCNQCIRWQVVEESIADVEDDTTTLGLRDISVIQACKDEAIGKLFLHLLSPR
jgi:hypothetical protein